MKRRFASQGHWTAALVLLCVAAFSTIAVGQELTLQHCWDAEREPLVHKMLAEFEPAHPGIKVNATLISCNELTQRFQVAVAAGVPPDIAHLGSFATVSFGLQGVLLPLDAYLERDGLSKDLWFPSELSVGQFDGITYGLPIRTGADDGNILFYNRDHFARAGLPDRAPQYWSELVEFSRRLIRYDGEQIVTGAIGRRNMIHYRWLYTGGTSLMSEDMRTVTFHSQAGVETVEFMNEFVNSVYRSFDDWTGDRPEFHAQSVSMLLSGPYELFAARQDSGIDIGFDLIALKGPDEIYRSANAGTHHYVIARDTKHPEAAWELLKWLTVRKESAGEFMLAQGRPSPIREYNFDPRYLEVNPEFPKFQYILARAVDIPMIPELNRVTTPFNQAFLRILRGDSGPVAALESAARSAQAALDEYWQRLEQQ